MWAIGFILLIVVYVVISIKLCAAAKGVSKRILVAMFWLPPFLLPFSFYLKPSYYEFRALCNDTNRYQVTNLEVDYVPPFSGCKMGFDVMNSKNYKGFECKSYLGKTANYPRIISLYKNFSFNQKWTSEECQHACFKGQPYAWEETCLDVCFNQTPIDMPSGGIDYKFNSADVIENRIRKHESYAINEKNEVIAKAINYIYYLYGNGAAKILGGDSGDAPTISCKVKYDIFKLDFLPKKVNQK